MITVRVPQDLQLTVACLRGQVRAPSSYSCTMYSDVAGWLAWLAGVPWLAGCLAAGDAPRDAAANIREVLASTTAKLTGCVHWECARCGSMHRGHKNRGAAVGDSRSYLRLMVHPALPVP